MLLIDCHLSLPHQDNFAKLFFLLAKSLPQGSDLGLPLLGPGLGCSSPTVGGLHQPPSAVAMEALPQQPAALFGCC